MDNYCFFVSLIALLVLGCIAEDPPIQVNFDGMEPVMYTSPNAEGVQFDCVLNRGPLFVTQNKMEIIHENPVTKEERTMVVGAILQEGADPNYYNVKIDNEGSTLNTFHVIFTIKSVRPEDDGKFICKAVEESTSDTSSAEVDVVVVRPVDKVHLQFDGRDSITSRPADPIEIDAGTYEVKCIATGSNPAVKEVQLFHDGTPVEPTSSSEMPANDTSFRSFVSSITASVSIDVKSSGKDLQCVAKDINNNAVISEIGISVNTYDPVIMCNDSDAHTGQMYATLTCLVNHTDIQVEDFAFQIGKTGEIIIDGGKNADNAEVKSKKISDSVTEVSLNLHKTEDWHFQETFYIVIRSFGGHVTKERVVLNKVERKTTPKPADNKDDDNDNDGDGDSGNVLDGKVALVLSIVIGLMMHLF